MFSPQRSCVDVPVVKQQPHSLSRAGVGHTEVHQQHQTGVWGVEQTHFQVEGFPQQHLQGLVILRVVAAVLGVWGERRWVEIEFIQLLSVFIHLDWHKLVSRDKAVVSIEMKTVYLWQS